MSDVHNGPCARNLDQFAESDDRVIPSCDHIGADYVEGSAKNVRFHQ